MGYIPYMKQNNLVNTGVLIKKEQREWLDKNSINLSDFVRKRIDKAMQGESKC